MRTYSCNSPQAAGRIVAISLLADGHLSSDELVALSRERIADRLGLKPGEFGSILQGLCEDLLAGSHLNWTDACKLDSDVMQQVMQELQDPVLRAEVLALCRTAINADRHVSESEAQMLAVLSLAWQVRPLPHAVS
ncbi:TerB family tellurite resistance protein [Paraburkholderia caballeronis]|uniref:Tellurite resistance protein TerB n=1 Tax=Paraburkholderia caballeronis TaxID=416943 RepID=A0A1H7KR21_9BURK|nr:TerB family tellurite resistance protein [Paraburkholderia caballeronis]PXW28128.1 hypothetical protein C7403_10219 [Paraburkholderia caballeronis]PXX03494.1 hypothetical protein C7407_10219 [Paraburkholderia caballeronis]RAK04238.1 hypothetical protein C7409_10219 [Paraburkholderia caballeronis]TDV19281.1 hypothetical protein C7408_10223 [Paraburkholderia caballeronis]TDV21881.1 hypothetical protein C7406_10123 [Paraburkholderia caballeronis]